MNIVEDLGLFYQNNESDLIKSISLDDNKNKNGKLINNTFVILDSKTLNVKDVYKMQKGKEGKITNNGKDIPQKDIDYLKELYLCSSYLQDDANNAIVGGGKGCKKISSVTPQIFRFRNKKNDSKIDFIDQIRDNDIINLHYPKLFTSVLFSSTIDKLKDKDEKKCEDIIKSVFTNYTISEDNKEILYSFGFNSIDIDYMFKYTDFVKELKNSVDSHYFSKIKVNKKYKEILNIKVIDEDLKLNYEEDLFIVLDEDLKDIRRDYELYLETKLYNNNTGGFKYTIGSNQSKRYKLQNINVNLDNSFYNINSTQSDVLRNFVLFSEIFKFIPNKYIFIDAANTFYTEFSEEKISELIDGISKKSKKENVKVLHINNNGEIVFYDSINTTNVKFKYQRFIKYTGDRYEVSFDYGIEEYTRYELYRRMMGLLNNSYISFFGDNGKKKIDSTMSNNIIMLTGLFDSIKDELAEFLYKNNDNVDIGSIFNKIEKFFFDNKLYMSSKDGILAVDKYKVLKILELNRNIKNKYTTMSKIKENAKKISGKYKVPIVDLSSSLNEKGQKVLNSTDKKDSEKLDRWKKTGEVSSTYLSEFYLEDQSVSSVDKKDIKLFSYVLGVLTQYEISHSVSSRTTSNIFKFKDVTVEEALDKFIRLSEVYNQVDTDDRVKNDFKYKKMLQYIISFVVGGESKEQKVDFNCVLLGSTETRNFFNKTPNYSK